MSANQPSHPTPERHRSPLRQALSLALGWAVVLAVLIAVGLLITGPLTGSLGAADNRLEVWLSARRAVGLTHLAEDVALAGDTRTELILGPLLVLATWVWSRLRSRGSAPVAFLAAAIVGEVGLYLVTVNVVSRPRPPVRLLDPGLDPNHSYPSGHVAAAAAMYGGLAVLITVQGVGRWRWLAAGLLVLPPLVAVARLYEGVHHLSDVLASLVSVSVWLAIVATVLLRDDSAPGAMAPE